jgi:hypothetical protein
MKWHSTPPASAVTIGHDKNRKKTVKGAEKSGSWLNMPIPRKRHGYSFSPFVCSFIPSFLPSSFLSFFRERVSFLPLAQSGYDLPVSTYRVLGSQVCVTTPLYSSSTLAYPSSHFFCPISITYKLLTPTGEKLIWDFSSHSYSWLTIKVPLSV